MTCAVDKSNIEVFLGNLDMVPGSPLILGKLLGLFQEMDADLDEVVQLISQDPVLVLKVLKKANSNYFGLHEKVTDIFDATTSLGLYEIYCITNTLLAQQAMQFARSLQDFDMNWFWKHSVSTAVIAETLSGGDPFVKSTVYTAGLLHDIGSILLASSDARKFSNLRRRRSALETDRLKEEVQAFGYSHDIVGAHLLSLWGLPESICSSVFFHHQHIPRKMGFEFGKIHAILRVSNCLSHYMFKPELGMSFVLDRSEEELAFLQINPEDFSWLILNSKRVMDKIQTLL